MDKRVHRSLKMIPALRNWRSTDTDVTGIENILLISLDYFCKSLLSFFHHGNEFSLVILVHFQYFLLRRSNDSIHHDQSYEYLDLHHCRSFFIINKTGVRCVYHRRIREHFK